jgi:predicted PolB exonuclease-like 3'-5' exonuclease
MTTIGRPPILCFDIETLPDPKAIRAMKLGDAADDHEAIEQAKAARLAQSGSDFLPIPCQKVLVASCVLRTREGLQVLSLEDVDGVSEAKVVQDFFALIDRHVPQLVSWNGAGFDLPVFNLRAMVHGVAAPTFWDTGAGDKDFKWNNYQSRYHTRHLDVMDALAMHNNRASAKLDVMARLCGFPGKVGGVDGSQVYDTWRAGQQEIVRKYCETDVMNTYLLYLRYLQVTGGLSPEAYDAEMQVVVDTLDGLYRADPQGASHWDEFLTAWVGPPKEVEPQPSVDTNQAQPAQPEGAPDVAQDTASVQEIAPAQASPSEALGD